MSRSIGIDEEGAIQLNGLRVEDDEIGQELLSNIQRLEKDRFITTWDGENVLVEPFDEPLVVKHVSREGDQFKALGPYGFERGFSLESLCLDEWDRFHGLTDGETEPVDRRISFVFSRQAQMEFFDIVDEFDDESVTVGDERFDIPPFFIENPAMVKSAFWDGLYNAETAPGWELGEPARALIDVLPQLKLNKSRILVLGCGSGQDAAHLAGLGHIVTAVDFSTEAITRAKRDFGSVPNLEFLQQDVFNLKITGPFDVIFEHTLYPAIPPARRAELVALWRKLLVPRGHLLGIFLVMSKRSGPPFGASEWELRERLKKGYRFLYWTRWKNSLPRREGRELVIYAQKV